MEFLPRFPDEGLLSYILRHLIDTPISLETPVTSAFVHLDNQINPLRMGPVDQRTKNNNYIGTTHDGWFHVYLNGTLREKKALVLKLQIQPAWLCPN